jgi:hypothetical protein|tara:strand:+ start:179 stop:562 length:384 start_codon:yes stop_codon:yes gene_type:complete
MFTNNPQSFMNGYLSGMRNSIITVSLGIAIYGFSRSFKKKSSRKTMKRLSVLMYLFSFMIILNTTLLLRNYLLLLTEKEKNEMPKYINLNQWKRYEYLGWLFTIITFLFISLGLSGDIMYIFNLLIQ